MRTLLTAAPIALLLSACSGSLCDSKSIQSLRSPNGEHQAIMFMRECGATTDFTTQVSIDPWFWQGIGNAFVADGYNGGTRGNWGGPWAEMKWTGSNKLLITYDRQARIFDRNAVVGGVHITYRAIDR